MYQIQRLSKIHVISRQNHQLLHTAESCESFKVVKVQNIQTRRFHLQIPYYTFHNTCSNNIVQEKKNSPPHFTYRPRIHKSATMLSLTLRSAALRCSSATRVTASLSLNAANNTLASTASLMRCTSTSAPVPEGADLTLRVRRLVRQTDLISITECPTQTQIG